MALDRIMYRLTYRLGTPRWDTGMPQPDLEQLVRRRAPGRALDLGCGSGADAVYLAGHGWQAVGIDFAPEAIAAAKKKAEDAGVDATFVLGDASVRPIQISTDPKILALLANIADGQPIPDY